MFEPAFTLRPAVPGDAAFLTEMLVAAANWWDDGALTPGRVPLTTGRVLATPELAHYVAGWPLPGDLGVVAADGDRSVGAAWLRYLPADDPGYGFVAPDVPELSIGVVAPWRGRGVGRALLRELLRRAAGAGVGRVALSVERANRAWRLYRDEGFTVVVSGRDADTMVRELAGAVTGRTAG